MSFINARKYASLLLCSLVALIFMMGALSAQNISFLRIGTGSTAGTYYPIGTLIASVISSPPGSRACEDGGSCGVPGLIATAQTTHGSVDNINGVSHGLFETALAQSDIIAAAYNGTGIYAKKKPVGNIRVIANLYPEDIHLVVRTDAGIRTVADLKGKRVSIDSEGSGTRVNALEILNAYGLRLKNIKAVMAGPNKAVTMMLNGELDAFFFVAGYPAAAVSELADLEIVDLVPIDGKVVEKLVEKTGYYSLSNIPAGTYRNIDATPTLAVSTQWIISEHASDELVYELTKALWNPRNRHLLDRGHSKGLLIHLDTALKGVTVPLHPGAALYYKQIGLLDQ